MSASAIADGIINNLTAGSALGACRVKTDYSVLETSSTCSAVVEFLRIERTPSTFGPQIWDNEWTFSLVGYLKDTGNPHQLMRDSLVFVDTVITSFQSDPTIQGTVDSLRIIRGRKRPGETFQPTVMGGQSWVPIYMELTAVEYVEL